MDKAKIAAQFIGAIPFARALGMALEQIGDGWARISMPYSDKLVGEPRTGVIHGGAVSALMDTCGGAAVMSHPQGAVSTATIDLRIDYMRAATPGRPIVAEATCHHVTRNVAFVRAVATDGSEAEGPVATATGAFTFERQDGGTPSGERRDGATPSGERQDGATPSDERQDASSPATDGQRDREAGA